MEWSAIVELTGINVPSKPILYLLGATLVSFPVAVLFHQRLPANFLIGHAILVLLIYLYLAYKTREVMNLI